MLRVVKLEDRIVLDAAAMLEAAEHAVTEIAAQGLESLGQLNDALAAANPVEQAAEAISKAAITSTLDELGPHVESAVESAGGSIKVVMIDSQLENANYLATIFGMTSHVVLYDSNTDSVESIVNSVVEFSAEAGKPVSDLTLLSHGSGGQVEFGNQTLTAGNLGGDQPSWDRLGESLSPNAQINLYACNLVDGSGQGQALMEELAEATGATVYGSDDITGRGGDWSLEHSSDGPIMVSEITPMVMADALARWQGQMAQPLAANNAILWLQSDKGTEDRNGNATANNGQVEVWKDQSGQGNDVTQFIDAAKTTRIGNSGVALKDNNTANGFNHLFFADSGGAATDKQGGLTIDLRNSFSASELDTVTSNINGTPTTGAYLKAGEQLTAYIVIRAQDGSSGGVFSWGQRNQFASTSAYNEVNNIFYDLSGLASGSQHRLGLNDYKGNILGVKNANGGTGGGEYFSANTNGNNPSILGFTLTSDNAGVFEMWVNGVNMTSDAKFGQTTGGSEASRGYPTAGIEIPNDSANNGAAYTVRDNRISTQFGIGFLMNNKNNNPLLSPDEGLSGDVWEVILFKGRPNDAEQCIINNYLSAKYATPIAAAADKFIHDNTAGGKDNFDYDLNGIGVADNGDRVDTSGASSLLSSISDGKQSSGAALTNGQFFMVAHDNGALTTGTNTDTPDGLERLGRQWIADNDSGTNAVATVDLKFDISNVAGVTGKNVYLLIDSDDDGDYTSATDKAIKGVLDGAGNVTFNDVAIPHCNSFTIAFGDPKQTPPPTGPSPTPPTPRGDPTPTPEPPPVEPTETASEGVQEQADPAPKPKPISNDIDRSGPPPGADPLGPAPGFEPETIISVPLPNVDDFDTITPGLVFDTVDPEGPSDEDASRFLRFANTLDPSVRISQASFDLLGGRADSGQPGGGASGGTPAGFTGGQLPPGQLPPDLGDRSNLPSPDLVQGELIGQQPATPEDDQIFINSQLFDPTDPPRFESIPQGLDEIAGVEIINPSEIQGRVFGQVFRFIVGDEQTGFPATDFQESEFTSRIDAFFDSIENLRGQAEAAQEQNQENQQEEQTPPPQQPNQNS